MPIRKTLAVVLGGLLLFLVSSVGFSQVEPSSSGTLKGSLELFYEVEISAQADGLIQQLLTDEGRSVVEGDVLVTIDARVAQAEVAVAKKELEAATKQAEQTADIEYAQASQLVSAAEYDDIRNLVAKGAASTSELRRAKLEDDKGRLAVGVAEIKHQQDQLAADVAQEKLNAADVRLSLFSVKAPFGGMVVERLRDRGEWTRAGEPILKLVHLNELKVQCLVPVDQYAPSELLGAQMKVSVPVGPQLVADVPTTIEFVSPVVTVHGDVVVWGRIRNERAGPNRPWLYSSGMPVSIEIVRQ